MISVSMYKRIAKILFGFIVRPFGDSDFLLDFAGTFDFLNPDKPRHLDSGVFFSFWHNEYY